MPTRKWSAAILGRVWPRTDPEVLQDASNALRAKGLEMLRGAEGLRDLARDTAANESGQFITAFCDKQYELAAIASHQADDGYLPMSRALEEAAYLVYGLREDLDEIDRQAEEDIQQLEQSPGPKAIIMAQIFARVAAASAAADARSAATMAAVAGVTNMFSSMNPTATSPGSLAGNPGAVPTGFGTGPGAGPGQHVPSGGGLGPGNFPLSPAFGGGKAPSEHGGGRQGTDLTGGAAGKDPVIKPAGNGQNTTDGEHGAGHQGTSLGAGGADANGDPAGLSNPERAGEHQGKNFGSSGFAPAPLPATPASNGSGGGFGSPSGGGFKLPSSGGGMGGGGGGMPAGLGSGFPQGLPSGGLGGPGSMAPPSAAPAAAPPPLSTDFSKGFGAGLSSAGAPPPAAFAPVPPPQAPPGAGAPAGAMPTGPAPVAAAGGSAVSTPAPAPVAAPMPSGPVGGGGVPSAPVGPLPPFGSDIPRSAPVAGPAVTPAASGSPSAPATGGGPSGVSGPVAPVPPGVVGTGAGAAAGATAESVRASLPDPLLESAIKVLQQLLHDSRAWPVMDWAVGVFKTRSGVETIINNGDGLGFIPADMFIPRSARMLFAEPSLPQEFRSQWFAWANPAESVIAYAKMCAETDPSVELWALAVSTGIGGSVVPARAAGVPHFDEVTRFDSSPAADAAPSALLDGSHMHRLETVDPAAYAQLMGVGDGPRLGKSKAWIETEAAVRLVLERAGMVRELAVPPAIRDIMGALKDGMKPRAEYWDTLRDAMFQIAAMGGGLRPGFGADDAPATAFVRASHDLTRLCELLLLWEHGDVKFPELAYLVKAINSTPQV